MYTDQRRSGRRPYENMTSKGQALRLAIVAKTLVLASSVRCKSCAVGHNGTQQAVLSDGGHLSDWASGGCFA